MLTSSSSLYVMLTRPTNQRAACKLLVRADLDLVVHHINEYYDRLLALTQSWKEFVKLEELKSVELRAAVARDEFIQNVMSPEAMADLRLLELAKASSPEMLSGINVDLILHVQPCAIPFDAANTTMVAMEVPLWITHTQIRMQFTRFTRCAWGKDDRELVVRSRANLDSRNQNVIVHFQGPDAIKRASIAMIFRHVALFESEDGDVARVHFVGVPKAMF